jgi:serine/threonine-protein kinase HipA
MNFAALDVHIGERYVGILFKYGELIRLHVDPDYAEHPLPLLSLSLLTGDREQQTSALLDPFNPALNASRPGRLPSFFQNLLPEGILRKHIAALRNCRDDDYFELLAACGSDLPGNVYARPRNDRAVMEALVTQRHDALEMSVIQEPIEDAVSLSGIQPKLALVKDGGRYVAHQRYEGAHIIGKLPTAAYDFLPEVEYLSLALARTAGVTVCDAELVPMERMHAIHEYALGKSDNFLAVHRFDRDRPGRMHVEDFAQIMQVDPDEKYTGATYSQIANVMLAIDGLGEAAVLELFRRIAVSELLGNADFHLKNIGVIHFPDGRIALSPAYDIVAHSIYHGACGHALAFGPEKLREKELSPAHSRVFSNETGIPVSKLLKVSKEVCELADAHWPALIEASTLDASQKERLINYMKSRPMMQSLYRRRKGALARTQTMAQQRSQLD